MPISFDKIEQAAPGLVSLAKTAAASLDKHGLTHQQMAVYLVLDHSGSMRRFYADGSVQRLAEQSLALSTRLDDDGTVPVVFFASGAQQPMPVSLVNYSGVIDREHPRMPWGTTNYVAAMRQVADHYRDSGASDPALVLFQTDGEPDDRGAVEAELRHLSKLPLFWSFIGFGGRVSFLERLDDLTGRMVDNAAFFHARDPYQVSDAELLDGVTREIPAWLHAAAAAGITRQGPTA
ncbi:VWA domain-containing protein [Streptomyces sp. NPDC048389]|uniref:VWA domain-containing protein n=1 Tax=Streptomyces sp. NPDC048389 TaxID=3154622 RepID=UPI003453DA4D